MYGRFGFGREPDGRHEVSSMMSGSSLCMDWDDNDDKKYPTDMITRRCEICGYVEEILDTEELDEKTIKKIMNKPDVRRFDKLTIQTEIGGLTVVACDKCIEKAKQNKLKKVFADNEDTLDKEPKNNESKIPKIIKNQGD